MRRLIHDLNNALSVITINVGLMREDAQSGDMQELRELIEEVAKAASHAGTLTNQLRRVVVESSESLPGPDGPRA